MTYGLAIALIVAGILVALLLNTTVGIILLVVGLVGLVLSRGAFGRRTTVVERDRTVL